MRRLTSGDRQIIKSFLEQDVNLQIAQVRMIGDIGWCSMGQFLVAVFPDCKIEVQLEILKSIDLLSCNRYRIFLKEVCTNYADAGVRWMALNPLTSLSYLHRADESFFHGIVFGAENHSGVRAMAAFGLVGIFDYKYPKRAGAEKRRVLREVLASDATLKDHMSDIFGEQG